MQLSVLHWFRQQQQNSIPSPEVRLMFCDEDSTGRGGIKHKTEDEWHDTCRFNKGRSQRHCRCCHARCTEQTLQATPKQNAKPSLNTHIQTNFTLHIWTHTLSNQRDGASTLSCSLYINLKSADDSWRTHWGNGTEMTSSTDCIQDSFT